MRQNNRLAMLQEVFEVHHGNKLDLNKMRTSESPSDAVAFIGRSGERNGLVAYVERLERVDPFSAGCITVALGGSALSSFVQPQDFYTAQNIDVLIPIEEMSLDLKLYYCCCVEANRFRYSTFGREANRTLKTLMVPTRDAIPTWVAGSSMRAVQELRSDLSEVIEE